MYVEDNSDKIIREAKIKAHGKCNRHMNHMNWDDVVNTAIVAIFVGSLAVMLATDTSYSRGKAAGEQEAQFNYPVTTMTPPEPEKKVHIKCDGGKTGNNIDFWLTDKSSTTTVVDYKSCSFGFN